MLKKFYMTNQRRFTQFLHDGIKTMSICGLLTSFNKAKDPFVIKAGKLSVEMLAVYISLQLLPKRASYIMWVGSRQIKYIYSYVIFTLNFLTLFYTIEQWFSNLLSILATATPHFFKFVSGPQNIG